MELIEDFSCSGGVLVCFFRMSSPSTSPKMACLCAPTSHAGSFRCRLHRPQQSWGRRPLPCRSSSEEDATDFAAEVEASVESRDQLSSCSSSSRAPSVSPATSPTSMSSSSRRTSRLKHTVTFSQEESLDASSLNADKSRHGYVNIVLINSSSSVQCKFEYASCDGAMLRGSV